MIGLLLLGPLTANSQVQTQILNVIFVSTPLKMRLSVSVGIYFGKKAFSLGVFADESHVLGFLYSAVFPPFLFR